LALLGSGMSALIYGPSVVVAPPGEWTGRSSAARWRWPRDRPAAAPRRAEAYVYACRLLRAGGLPALAGCARHGSSSAPDLICRCSPPCACACRLLRAVVRISVVSVDSRHRIAPPPVQLTVRSTRPHCRVADCAAPVRQQGKRTTAIDRSVPGKLAGGLLFVDGCCKRSSTAGVICHSFQDK